jgi:hypothetical protein
VVVLGIIFLPFNKFSFADMKNQLNQKQTDKEIK